jgi:aspartyl-tRNA(Asn)/glutamyl-tRNA(Gln) amidotransferase subunit A
MKVENLTIESARKGLMKKEFSASELVKFYLDKIKKQNKEINDFLEITNDLAIEQAKKVDDKISRRDKIGPIEGIPIAIKDNILVDGYKATAGSKILENYKAVYDATVIKKLKKEGAIIIGKTNLDEFAMGSSTENSAYGVVKNPLDKERVPGGSSGGSAAAVAANHCIVALGSDTGGSVRQPASFCGIVGFRPSYGMVSRYGIIAMASSLDQVGPLAKNVEDAKLVFDAIKGEDEMDSTTISKTRLPASQRGELARQANSKFQTIKIGIPKEYFGEGINKEVKEKINEAIKKFEDFNFEIKEISLPNTDYALPAYYIIAPAEISANLARYDGIKYGFRSKAAGSSLLNQYLQTRAEGFGDEVRRRIVLGTYVLSAGYRDAYYNKAQKVRSLIKQEFEKIFNDSIGGVDIILTPTAPTTAFKIGDKKDPLSMYLSDIYTIPVALAGLPSISIPCGDIDNLPVGLQLIGPQFKDDFVFNVAQTCWQLLSE